MKEADRAAPRARFPRATVSRLAMPGSRPPATPAPGGASSLTGLPRDLAESQTVTRTAGETIPFQADYARCAGVEGTMHQAASHGARRAR